MFVSVRGSAERYPLTSGSAGMGTLEVFLEREKRAYYGQLRQLLTEEVQVSFEEQHQEPTPRMAELLCQLDNGR